MDNKGGLIIMIGGLWVKVPCKILNDERMSRADIAVFAYMADRLKSKTAAVPISAIAHACEVSERTVIRSIDKLSKCGYLRAEKSKGRATVYTQLLLPAAAGKAQGATRAPQAASDGYDAERYKCLINQIPDVKEA